MSHFINTQKVKNKKEKLVKGSNQICITRIKIVIKKPKKEETLQNPNCNKVKEYKTHMIEWRKSNYLRRGQKRNTKSIKCTIEQRLRCSIVIACINKALKVRILFLDSFDGAPQNPFSAAAVVGVWMEESDRGFPVLPSVDCGKTEFEYFGSDECEWEEDDELYGCHCSSTVLEIYRSVLELWEAD